MLINIQRKKVLHLGSSITQLLRTLKLYDIITYKTQKKMIEAKEHIVKSPQISFIGVAYLQKIPTKSVNLTFQ